MYLNIRIYSDVYIHFSKGEKMLKKDNDEIFLDTDYFKALMFEDDENHDVAVEIKKRLNDSASPTAINTIVLGETLDIASKGGIFPIKINKIIKNNHKIYDVSKKDFNNALELCDECDNKVRFDECVNRITMMKHDINSIVTFENYFNHFNNITVINR